MRAVSVVIYGRVQGVWFRASTKAQADQLGIKGTVCNRADGTVYVQAHGEDDQISVFLKWCAVGPELARVDKLVIEDIDDVPTREFKILRK